MPNNTTPPIPPIPPTPPTPGVNSNTTPSSIPTPNTIPNPPLQVVQPVPVAPSFTPPTQEVTTNIPTHIPTPPQPTPSFTPPAQNTPPTPPTQNPLSFIPQKKKKHSILSRLIGGILNFEEKHPWLFFFFTACFLFGIVSGILSLVIGGNDAYVEEVQKPPRQVEIQKPPTQEIKGSQMGIQIATILLSENMFDNIIYKQSGETYLGNFMKDSQIFLQTLNFDIQQALDDSEDREFTLNEYDKSLKEKTFLSKENFVLLSQMQQELDTEKKRLYKAIKATKKTATQSYITGGDNELISKNKEYFDYLNGYSDVENKIEIVKMLLSLNKNSIKNAEARIEAIELNRQALITGITFTEVKDSGIDLTK